MTTRRVLVRALVAAAACALSPADGSAQIKGSEKATVSQTIDGTTITIAYSRPSLRGRSVDELFGDQIAWGRAWTPGANWATTIEADKDIALNGIDVPAGKYSIWMIPDEEQWEFALDPRDSLFHVAHPEPTDYQIRFPIDRLDAESSVETLVWWFPAVRATGADLRMQWDRTAFGLELKVQPSMKTTMTMEEAAPFLGTYKVTIPADMVMGDSDEPRVFELEFTFADERVSGDVQWSDDDSFLIFLVPKAEGIFASGYSVNGELTEVDEGTLWEFLLDDSGRATGFEVRFGNDRLWMSAERVEGS